MQTSLEILSNWWIWLCLCAFIAGYMDALVGGGGLITIPALLATGMHPHFVLGTNKLAASFGSVTAAYYFVHKGVFQPRLWIACVIATLFGAVLGASLVWLVRKEVLQVLIPVLTILVSIYALYLFRPAPQATHSYRQTRTKQYTIASLLGFYDGFAGPGTGVFWVSAANRVLHIPLKQAYGIARFMNAVSNITALVVFSIFGTIHFLVGLVMGSMLMVGAYAGSASAHRFAEKPLKMLNFGFITLLSGINLIKLYF